jgi:hypothetical protein
MQLGGCVVHSRSWGRRRACAVRLGRQLGQTGRSGLEERRAARCMRQPEGGGRMQRSECRVFEMGVLEECRGPFTGSPVTATLAAEQRRDGRSWGGLRA